MTLIFLSHIFNNSNSNNHNNNNNNANEFVSYICLLYLPACFAVLGLMCLSSLVLKFRERSKFIQLMEFGFQDRILDIGTVMYIYFFLPYYIPNLYTLLFKVVEEDSC